MRNTLLLMAVFVSLTFSCKTVKKAQGIDMAISKKDTTETVVIKESIKIDSAAIVKDILRKVMTNKIDFNTFNAKIKVYYEGVEKNDNYTVYLSMKKDSIILIKVTGSFLGIPGLGLEAKIKKDSVTVVGHAGEKYVMNRSINYLQDITEIPFDFVTLQDILIGNPVFVDSNVVSYREGNNQLLVLIVGELFKHLLTLDSENFTILHSKLDDVDLRRNRTCDFTFGTYKPMGNYQFATYRKISVAEKSKLDLYLDFKEYSLNEPLKYNFDPPKKYKRK